MSRINAQIAQKRDNLCRRLRAFLHERDFVEVHSPILLRSMPGTEGVFMDIRGEAYNLRRCMELKLRSALAEGLRSVFELGPCFRPEDSPDNVHHPEFHMLELFECELEYEGLLDLTRKLLCVAAENPALEFEVVDVSDWLARNYDIDVEQGGDSIRMQLVERGAVPFKFADKPAFEAINYVVGEYLEKGCGTKMRPALLHRYPACTVCLARRDADRPSIIERFEVFVEGLEVANGFVDEICADNVSVRMIENGPCFTDEPFIKLLRSGGLPPSAGVGFGIERLLMAFGGVGPMSHLFHENQFGRL